MMRIQRIHKRESHPKHEALDGILFCGHYWLADGLGNSLWHVVECDLMLNGT